MSASRRSQLAEAMDDERLADLLEELPEAEQLRIIEGLDIDRLVNVLEEMEYDDLADLLAEMPGEQRTRVPWRWTKRTPTSCGACCSYQEGTAGSLMTPEIIILGSTSTVAEALAQIRDPDWLVSIAAEVFVVQPPYKPPTGMYLGVVHFQRLLREPPAMELGRIVEQEPTVTPDILEREVAERLASYNLLSVGVCDEAGRLLGAITVDDVLDRTLPTGWRQRRRVNAGTVSRCQVPRDFDRTPPEPASRRPHYDPDAFGQFSEGIARYLGTARYLVYQTIVIVVWVGWNYLAPVVFQFDPYTLVLLTLALSFQASYATP